MNAFKAAQYPSIKYTAMYKVYIEVLVQHCTSTIKEAQKS